MEFEIKNARGETLRLFVEPGDNVLRFEVVPAPGSEPFASGSRPQDEPAVSTVDGPPVEMTSRA